MITWTSITSRVASFSKPTKTHSQYAVFFKYPFRMKLLLCFSWSKGKWAVMYLFVNGVDAVSSFHDIFCWILELFRRCGVFFLPSLFCCKCYIWTFGYVATVVALFLSQLVRPEVEVSFGNRWWKWTAELCSRVKCFVVNISYTFVKKINKNADTTFSANDAFLE